MLKIIFRLNLLFQLVHFYDVQAQPRLHFPEQYRQSLDLKDTIAIKNTIDSAVNLKEKNAEKAIDLLEQTSIGSLKQEYARGLALSLNHLTTLYSNKGYYEQSANLLYQMIPYCMPHKKLHAALPSIYNALGNYMQITGNYDSASHYFFEAIRLTEESGEKNTGIAALYANLSNIFFIIQEHDKALYYLNLAEKKARENSDMNVLTMALINKGNIFANLKNWTASDSLLQEGLQLAIKYDFKQWHYLSLAGLGNLYFSQEQYEKAIQYISTALKIDGNIDPSYSNAALTVLGKSYYHSKNHPQAEHYLKKALQYAQRLNITRDIQEDNKYLAFLYAQRGDYKKAFTHHYDYTLLKDSLLNEERIKINNQLETKYRTAQKDKEIIQKELEISNQNEKLKNKNLWLLGTSSGILLLLVIAGYIHNRYRRNLLTQIIQKERLNSMEQEIKITNLTSMMKGEEKERTRIARDLHDGIGGMLASIKMNINDLMEEYPEKHDKSGLARIADALTETAGEVRKTSHNLMPDALSRQNLREALIQYAENNSNKQLQIKLHYDVEEGFPESGQLFIYRIIQELVQNIVKHAEATYAVIQILLHNKQLSIFVEDNGTGFDTERASKGSGLQSIRMRVEMLQGFVDFSSKEGMGTTIHIEMEFEKLLNI